MRLRRGRGHASRPEAPARLARAPSLDLLGEPDIDLYARDALDRLDRGARLAHERAGISGLEYELELDLALVVDVESLHLSAGYDVRTRCGVPDLLERRPDPAEQLVSIDHEFLPSCKRPAPPGAPAARGAGRRYRSVREDALDLGHRHHDAPLDPLL